MRIEVLVKAGAKSREIVKFDELKYFVSVVEQPVRNKANDAVREILSDYFHKPKSKVTLTQGAKSRVKIFDIEQ